MTPPTITDLVAQQLNALSDRIVKEHGRNSREAIDFYLDMATCSSARAIARLIQRWETRYPAPVTPKSSF